MKFFSNKYTSNVIGAFFLSLMILLIVNQCVFIHTHELPDGTVIVHAHPFCKTTDNAPIKKHQHSDAEFILLSNISILFICSVFAVAFSKANLKIRPVVENQSLFIVDRVYLFSRRGPPVSCSSRI